MGFLKDDFVEQRRLHDLVGSSCLKGGGINIAVDSWTCGVIVEVCAPEWLDQCRWKSCDSRGYLIDTRSVEQY